MNESLREELKAMATEDHRLWQELLDKGELGEGYAPPMEALHRRNASRLKEIIAEHGWLIASWSVTMALSLPGS